MKGSDMKRDRVFDFFSRQSQRRMTWVLIAINVFWYLVVESVTGRSAIGLIRAGAMYSPLVTHGQWFRIISAMYVHVSVIHILVNMISLWSLAIVETIFSMEFMFVLYTVTGVVGNCLGLLLGPGAVSAGASGAIFGLFGAMLGLAFMKVLPNVVRNQLLLLLAINVVLDVTNRSTIDWVSHLGGLVAGVLLTMLYVRRLRSRRFWKIGAVVAAVLTLLALTVALCTRLPMMI